MGTPPRYSNGTVIVSIAEAHRFTRLRTGIGQEWSATGNHGLVNRISFSTQYESIPFSVSANG